MPLRHKKSLIFVLVFANGLFQLAAFGRLLWSISSYLVLILFLYAAVVTAIAFGVFGEKLVSLHFAQRRREADFRFGLVRVRENAEAIALYRGERQEKNHLNHVFDRLFENAMQNASSLGKVLGAHLPKEQLNALIERNGLYRLTQRTIVSRNRLIEELDTVRARGFASTEEEFEPRVRAVAAPIYAFGGMVTAAVGIMGANSQPIWNNPLEVVELVRRAARDISRRIS